MMQMTEKIHFRTLDCLRGVAAITVMLHHNGRALAPGGYLAVDFFFILSGFVIPFSYEEKLRSGMSFSNFLGRRLIRLYPMIIAGSLAGLFAAILQNAYRLRDVGVFDYASSLILSIALIPQLSGTNFGSEFFPFNVVVWSLFYELAANILYGAGGYRLGAKGICGLVVLSVALAAAMSALGLFRLDNFWTGIPRISFGFCTGMALYKLYASGAMRKLWPATFRPRAIPLSIFLLAVFAAPNDATPAYIILALAASIAIIIAAIAAESPGGNYPMQKFLGDISYPLYLLHRPLTVVLAIAMSGFLGETPAMRWMFLLISSTAIIGFSFVVFRYCDAPLRRYLTGKFLHRERPKGDAALLLALPE